MLKKILKRTAIVLLVLVALLLAAPFIFKSQIVKLVKTEINKNLTAKVEFSDVSISFFRHFPRVSVGLEDISVAGSGQFQGDTLFSARNMDAAVNLMSMIRGSEYKIYSVVINEPRVYAHVNRDGKANWDITIPDSVQTNSDGPSSPFSLSLEHYALHKAYIRYLDESSDMQAEIKNLEHEGSGDLTADIFTLKTKTSADELNFSYAGLPYFVRTKTKIDADFAVDSRNSKYSFKTDKVFLNELALQTEGFFQLVNDSVYRMDISFRAPSTDFKNILSLVPSIYQKDFSTIRTRGQAIFNGFVRGDYTPVAMPSYAVNLDVKNGFFQYPDLPQPVQHINLSMKVENPDGVTDHTVVNIPSAHMEMGHDPFDFHLLLRNPVSNMYVDAGVKGRMDLSGVSKFVKLDPGTKLAGLLDADLQVKGTTQAMQKQDMDGFTAAGRLDLKGFFYASKDYPSGMGIDVLAARFTPKNISVDRLDGKYLGTQFQAKGSFDNLPAYVMKDEPLSGSMEITADQIDLDRWMGMDTTATTSTAAPVGGAFLVPANLNMIVRTQAGKVRYDKLDLSAVSGTLAVNDETVFLKEVKANALEGTININGSYSTKLDKKHPDISLTYDLQGLDVQKTFYAINTVQKLMPVGKFIAGKMSSKLTMTGKLGEDMMPDMNSLTGSGNLLLIDGFLKKFAPLDKLATTLNVEQLQDISLKDIKNHIEFTNGRVTVSPFTVHVKDIDMEIGGTHGLDQSLNYIIDMRLPRALMGTKGNQLVDGLVTRAASRGITVKPGETVNLKVNMGGSITSPVITTDLKAAASSLAADMQQQALDLVKSRTDSAKKMVKDTVTAMKKEVVAAAKQGLLNKLAGSRDSTSTTPVDAGDIKKRAENTGKEVLKGLFGKKKKG